MSLCWMLFYWMSLYWMPLCWMPLCSMLLCSILLCWMPLYWMSLRWMPLCCHYAEYHYAECRYAECRSSLPVILTFFCQILKRFFADVQTFSEWKKITEKNHRTNAIQIPVVLNFSSLSTPRWSKLECLSLKTFSDIRNYYGNIRSLPEWST